uniref:Uncharacterized protein n=1 Tax=Rhinolophus ferrumequinum TaxID=59479 RepID=A0A671FA02_RHIFE
MPGLPPGATHRSRWLSRSVSGLSSTGTKSLRRPSSWRLGSSESTVSTAVMPAPCRRPGSATAAAPPRYSPGRTCSIPGGVPGARFPHLPTWRRPRAGGRACHRVGRLERPPRDAQQRPRRTRPTAECGLSGK